MNGRFITKDDMRSIDPIFKQEFIYTFPKGCFIPDSIIDKILSIKYNCLDLLMLLKPKNLNFIVDDCICIFNEHGFLIELKDDNFQLIYEYHKHNVVGIKDKDDYWYKYEYDSNDNLIKQVLHNDIWYKYEYDEDNTLIIINNNGSTSTYQPKPLDIPEELLNYLKLSTFLYNNQ